VPDGARSAAAGRPGALGRLVALADAGLPAVLGLAFAGGLGVFVAWPVARVFVTSFEGDAGLTLAHYAKFFRTTYFLLSLRNSVVLATVVTLLAVTVGFAVAVAVTRGPRRLRWPFRLVALLPLVAPSYVFGVALIIVGGRRGLLNVALGTDFRVLGWPGVIMGQALTLFPLAFLMIESVLATVDRNLEDGASDLGASDLQVLRTVTLPLVAPGLLKAALMVFALSMADFATPAVLGGGLAFLAQDALLLVIGAEYDLGMASVLCVFLMLPSLLAFLVHHRWLVGRSYVTVTGRGAAAEPRNAVPAVDGPALALTGLACLAVLLPIGVVVMGAVTRFVGVNNALTLEHFANLRGIRSLELSLRMAGAAAVCVAVGGLLLAYLIARTRFPGRRVIEMVSLLGFALPGTVLGIGYVLTFNEPPLKLTGTFWILVINCAFHYLAVAVEAGLGKLAQIDPSLEEASADLGIGRLETFARVVLPLMGTAFLVALTYAFVNSMLTLSAIVFLISPGREPAASVIFTFARMGELGRASALSLLMMGVVLAALGLLWTVARRSGRLALGSAR
jgi:iron(III) transport system permease protein